MSELKQSAVRDTQLIEAIFDIARGLYDKAPDGVSVAEIIERSGLIVELSEKIIEQEAA